MVLLHDFSSWKKLLRNLDWVKHTKMSTHPFYTVSLLCTTLQQLSGQQNVCESTKAGVVAKSQPVRICSVFIKQAIYAEHDLDESDFTVGVATKCKYIYSCVILVKVFQNIAVGRDALMALFSDRIRHQYLYFYSIFWVETPKKGTKTFISRNCDFYNSQLQL